MRETPDSTRPERYLVGTWLEKKGKITGTRGNNDRRSFTLQRHSGKKVVMHLVGILLVGMVSLLGCAPNQEEATLELSATSSAQEAATLELSGTSPAPKSNPTETIAVDESSELTVVPTTGEVPVPALGLCEDDWEGEYCINTVGNSNDQQLISLKYSDTAETEVYLVVNGDIYYCLTMDDYPGNLYCFGPLLSNQLGAEVEIFTAAEKLALARGIVDFPILEPVPTKPSDDPGYY